MGGFACSILRFAAAVALEVGVKRPAISSGGGNAAGPATAHEEAVACRRRAGNGIDSGRRRGGGAVAWRDYGRVRWSEAALADADGVEKRADAQTHAQHRRITNKIRRSGEARPEVTVAVGSGPASNACGGPRPAWPLQKLVNPRLSRRPRPGFARGSRGSLVDPPQTTQAGANTARGSVRPSV